MALRNPLLLSKDNLQGLKNEINTCFVNAALQALFACYRKPLKETAQKELAYHKAWMKLKEIISDREDKKGWVLDPGEIKGILIMMARQKEVDFNKLLKFKDLSKSERILFQFINSHKKEPPCPWPDVPDFSAEELKEMVAIFRKDPIFKTMFTEQDKEHLKAFQTLSDLIEDYTRREALLRGNVKDLSSDNVGHKIEISCLRAFLPSGGRYSQEDAAEFITALFKWIRGCEYPHTIPICKLRRHKAKYEIPTESFQDDKGNTITAEKIKEEIAKNLAVRKAELDPLPLKGWNEELLPDPCIRLECPSEEGPSGQQLIESWFDIKQPQTLTESYKYNNLYYHREGAYYVDQEKNDLVELPEQLMIELKRYNCSAGQRRGEKKDTPVFFSETLLIKNQPYRLQAVIFHKGETEEGHYKAYLRSEKWWWECDDTKVFPATQAALIKALSQGYLYVLQKIKTSDETA